MTLKSHITLWMMLANTLGVNEKSLATFTKRCSEGLPFLHVVLPQLAKDVDLSLSTGQLVVTAPFGLYKETKLPVFLYELFIQAYDTDGYVNDNHKAIKVLRQLLFLFYKFEMPFSSEQKELAYAKFIKTDSLVKQDSFPASIFSVRSNFRKLLPENPLDIRAHHSGGATADRFTNSQKRSVRRYIPSLMGMYNLSYFFNTQHHAAEWFANNELVNAEPKSKVTLVPKDSRGPRIICMEPHERMFIQKGLMALLYDHIQLVSPAKGYINFTNQSINRRLARQGSMDGSYATIDLKDASDMVPWNLVKKLATTEWLDALSATRSTVATVNGLDLEFKKFAPMGSALCFPIEAMIFWSIAKTITDEVYVYGDDIIVRNEVALDVIAALESYGLVVNHDKTLFTGSFRESCGGEYFHGEDISYIKCKSFGLPEFVAFCNLITESYGSNVSSPMIEWYENTFQTYVYRQSLQRGEYPSLGVYYSDDLRPNYRMLPKNKRLRPIFKRRYNMDTQQVECRYLHNSNKHMKHNVSQSDQLFDALTQLNVGVQPELERRQRDIMADLTWNSYYQPMSSFSTEYDVRDANPTLKFAWGSL